MRLRERKKAETHRVIVAAAEALFRERGFAGTRIRDIAESAGVSPQTVFNYFPNKDAILSQLAIEWYRGMAQWVAAQHSEPSATDSTALDAFLEAVRWGTNALVEERSWIRLLVTRSQVLHSDFISREAEESSQARELVEQFEANRSALCGLFESFQKAGILRDDIDPAEITHYYAAIYQGILLDWASRPGDVGQLPGERIADALQIMFRGLSPATT